MSTPANYNRLMALLLLASGIGLIIWSALGFVDSHYPHLLGKHGNGGVVIESAANKPRATDYNVSKIVAAHLFGKADQQKVVQRTTNAPQTKLKLKLIGVMASEDENYARAMIQVNAKGTKTYAIGQSIDGTDAQLHKVENEKVILDRKGNLESLAMGLQKTKINRSKPGTS